MLGDCQGQHLVGGEKDIPVYLRALFKSVFRGGQTRESEQTEGSGPAVFDAAEENVQRI